MNAVATAPVLYRVAAILESVRYRQVVAMLECGRYRSRTEPSGPVA